jgi:hypothetical protein
MRTRPPRPIGMATALLAVLTVVACTLTTPPAADVHRWWAGFGLVVPHENFPSDCKLCHLGSTWNVLRDDFVFDHGARTGVPLEGAHARAMCLRCHNDRGPVSTFRAQGCAGCHEDVHYGELGQDCARCHDERLWYVPNMRVGHLHTRLPLTGAHLQVACHRCHAGASVANFRPTDPDCASCHQDEAVRTTNPPHLGLGWSQQDCSRCHQTTGWRPAQIR